MIIQALNFNKETDKHTHVPITRTFSKYVKKWIIVQN